MLPEARRAAYVGAYAAALNPVFETAAAIALLGFWLTLGLREIALRKTSTAAGIGQAFAMPQDATSLEELERIVANLAQNETRWRLYHALAQQTGTDIDPREMWFLFRLGERDRPPTEDELCQRVRRERALLHTLADRNIARGLVTRDFARRLDFTAAGRSLYTRVLVLRRHQLESLLQRWHTSKHADVRGMLAKLARHLSTSPPLLPEAR